MVCEFLRCGDDNPQPAEHRWVTGLWQIEVIIVGRHGQRFLPPGHAEIDLGKQLRIEQRPVQLPMAIGDVVAGAEGV